MIRWARTLDQITLGFGFRSKPAALCRIRTRRFASKTNSCWNMGTGEEIGRGNRNEEYIYEDGPICLHAFSDLSHVSPAAFIYLLKECYLCGTRKANDKFRVLQQHVSQSLNNAPQPGPYTFVVQCLYVLPLLGVPHAEGFSHLLFSSLRRLKKQSVVADSSEAKRLAAQLFLDILSCSITHEEHTLLKLLEVFDVELKEIGEALCGLESNDGGLDIAKAYVERQIFRFIESQSYMTAVTLSEHFSIYLCGQPFLVKMVQFNQFEAAEKWATFMGKPMICLLVQQYLDMKMLKNAYNMIKKHNLKEEFPDVYHLYKESSLKKLAKKGCWDVAELRTNKDRRLLEYLVYLAMEAGYTEKVDELCERYSLENFDKFTDATLEENSLSSQENSLSSRYLDLQKFGLDAVTWVDDIDGLLIATNYIVGCKVVGIDCEWKPNYEKGRKPNKVSIMQIASDYRVYIFDLIKLYKDEPKALDSSISCIFCSPDILKLGYSLQCDLHQLSCSYGDLECFRYYEMLLDIQKLFNEPNGGLSGLCKKILGAGLNKTRRNSNWEQRPLSCNQIEYAALDAAALIHIFRHVSGQPHSTGEGEGSKVEWKSHIVSHMGKIRRKNASKD